MSLKLITVKECSHPINKRATVVVSGFANWEVTRIKCLKCQTYLTAPKTD